MTIYSKYSNEDEMETLQTEIRKEAENYEQVKEEYERLQDQLKTTMEKIHSLCIKMKVIIYYQHKCQCVYKLIVINRKQ